MKHLRIFSKNFKNVLAKHDKWDPSWGIDKWPSFNSATQLYIITDPLADINESGQWIQPSNYSSQNPGYTYVNQSNLERTPLTGLNITSGDSSADLTWDSISGFTYKVLRNGIEVYSGSSNSFLDSGLTNGQEYTYEVYPVNSYGTWGIQQTQKVIPNV